MSFLGFKRKSDNHMVIEDLKKASGGSFVIVYQAMQELSKEQAGSNSPVTELNRSELLRKIETLKSKMQKHQEQLKQIPG